MAHLSETIEQTLSELYAAYERKSPVWGLSTSFPAIDEFTGGLHGGETIIVGARPSVGKSSLISQITFGAAVNLLEDSNLSGMPEGQVLYFSPEMSPTDLIRRQASQIAHVTLSKIRSGRMSEDELSITADAMRSINDLGQYLKVEAGKSMTIDDIVAKARSLHLSGPDVKLVAVDYLTRIDAGVGQQSEYTAANRISRALKDLALELNTTVLVGAQLSRKGDRVGNADDPGSRYPRLSDLRDSGRIEEDADCVWLVHRDNEFAMSEDEMIQSAVLIIAKNRNGPTGIIELYFEPHYTRFSDGRNDG